MAHQPRHAEFQPPPRRLQFSLQTMLVFMLLAALIFGWFLTPRMQERTLGGGALIIRGQWAGPASNVNSTLSANSTSPDIVHPAYEGLWLLYDRYERKLAEGRYRDDLPTGRWRYFAPEGHIILEGNVNQGTVDGPWSARHADESVRQQATYTQREYRREHVGPDRFGFSFPPPAEPFWIAQRSGQARRYWTDGRIRSRGHFRDDRRVGKWTFFDEQGKKTVEGNYRDGRKHGVWHRWPSPGGEPKTEFFLHGRRVDNPDTLLAQFSADLLSPETRRQVQAARGLDLFGNRAVPALREALTQGSDAQQLLAIRGLMHLGPAAAAAVDDLAAAGNDEHPRVRRLSMVALAEVDPKRAKALYQQLLSATATDNAEERELVIACLAQAGPTGLQQLFDYRSSHQNDVGLAAFEAMARMYETYLCNWPERGDPRVDVDVLDAIFQLMEKHADPRISERAEGLVNRSRRLRGHRPVPFEIQGGVL